MFTDKNVLGLTNCAPVLRRQDEKSDQFEFYATMCVDLDPSGPLNEYLAPQNDKYATYLMFNNDAAFDTISDVESSEFKQFVQRIVGESIREAGDWESVEIKQIEAQAKRARIYDKKHVTWGAVDFSMKQSQGDAEEDLKLYYVVENIFVDFRNNQLESERDSYHAKHVYDTDADVIDYKHLKLAFFVEGSKLADRINSLNRLLIKDVFYQVLIVILMATTILIILGVMRVKRLSIKMTAQIIYLYETLY